MESTAIAEPSPDAPPSQQTVVKPRKIFISYAHEDQEFAFKLRASLKEAKLNAWIDDDIEPGEGWSQRIADEIQDSTECIVILSPAAIASHIVEGEVLKATRRNVTVRPVMYVQCEPWVHIETFHYIDFAKDQNYEKCLKQLIRPPRQTLWERILPPGQIRASRPYLAIIALGIVIVVSVLMV